MRETNGKKKILAYLLTGLMVLGLLGAASPAGGWSAGQVYAVSAGTNFSKGDTLVLRSGTWEKEYLVLDPVQTNSKEPGTFVLQKYYYSGQESRFDANGTSNVWEGSTAQAKCTEYYNSLPESLRDVIVGVTTSETGPVGANNIDGTRTGEDAAKDKVFAMSFAEYYIYRDYITKTAQWWLRSPVRDETAKAKSVDMQKATVDSPVSSSYVIRPAFNLRLPDEFCASSKELADGTTEWTVDTDKLSHSYDSPFYTWSGGGAQCTAKAICSVCGRTVREKVYTTSDISGDGATVYTASFTDPLFTAQTKTVRADSPENLMSPGDLLRVRDGSVSTDYIVLDPRKMNTGDDGMFVLLKESTEKTAYDTEEQSNQWEGSTAQSWCTAYYRSLPDLIRNAVTGVRTQDTESGQDWLGVNNIDGTTSDKDKVFFLSYKEYLGHKDLPHMITGYKWLLRNYGVDCASDIHAYVGVIQENGEPKDYGIHSSLAARPAFNLVLPEDVYASPSTEGTDKVWTIDVNHPGKPDESQAGEKTDPEKKTDKTDKTVKTTVKLNKKLPKVTILKPKAGKKAFTARWKKLSAKKRNKIQGIEVQYANNKSFRKAAIKTAKKSAKKLKIKGLKRKKTYWVRIRTYKKKGSTKYVSRWSKKKKIRVK